MKHSNKVQTLGQVFTPPNIVKQMLALRHNYGSTLEPSVGDGAFFDKILYCHGIEIDPKVCPQGCENIDFFLFPKEQKFDTIIGNPPYVAYKHIPEDTKKLLQGFDKRTNLYLFFVDKCLDHLEDRGELIFITPRDFLKATSALKLNEKIYNMGTITDLIDLGDQLVFKGYSPNCIIWRFEKDNYTRKTGNKNFRFKNGQLHFSSEEEGTEPLSKFFNIHVGAVSGLDELYVCPEGTNEEFTKEFVYSKTRSINELRKMYWGKSSHLEKHKDVLINRKIKHFTEKDWWEWGRKHHESSSPRIYVNCKTREKNPFYTHPCKDYDGSVLALFPKVELDINEWVNKLNQVNWEELGFVCDGRFIFSQKSLENVMLNLKKNC